MEIAGINVERILCKNTYTTKITNIMASIKVFMTLWIEASKKSFVLIRSTSSIPFGKVFEISATTLSISSIISLAFDPDV